MPSLDVASTPPSAASEPNRPTRSNRTWIVPAATVAVVLQWASAFVAIRQVGDTFSPGPLALARLTVGSLALAVLAVRVRRPLPRGKTLGLVIAYGVLWFAGYTVVLNAAERHLDAGTAALLVNFAPIIVAVLAGLFMGEGFPRPLMIGIVVAFAGALVVSSTAARLATVPWRMSTPMSARVRTDFAMPGDPPRVRQRTLRARACSRGPCPPSYSDGLNGS